MIKARKNNFVLLGLSEENLKRLRRDQPIKFNMKDLGLPDMEVIIFYGETEEDMVNLLLDHGRRN